VTTRAVRNVAPLPGDDELAELLAELLVRAYRRRRPVQTSSGQAAGLGKKPRGARGGRKLQTLSALDRTQPVSTRRCTRMNQESRNGGSE
jgi:hypothetical protein